MMKKFLTFLLSWSVCATLCAQGLLPKGGSAQPVKPTAHGEMVLIGEQVPEDVIVVDAHGTKRPLLSYKAGIEVLFVVFLSAQCSTNSTWAPEFQRFYEAYKGWHVSFVAVDVDGTSSVAQLSEWLKNNGLPWPVVTDVNGSMTRTLGVSVTPDILITDEVGVLRYRGPLRESASETKKRKLTPFAKNALDTVIGHVEPVAQPEPGNGTGCPIP